MRICSYSLLEAMRPSKDSPCSTHTLQGPSHGHTHLNSRSISPSMHLTGHPHLSPGRPGPWLG